MADTQAKPEFDYAAADAVGQIETGRGYSEAALASILRFLFNQAGGPTGVETFEFAAVGLRIHRRRDGGRWRRPITGRRRQKTSRFFSAKNVRPVECESDGERSLFKFLEVYPPVRSFREQHDLVELRDAEGLLLAFPDASADERDARPVCIEGKYLEGLDRAGRARLRRIQSAFERAGLTYVLIDQGWCAHAAIAVNVDLVFQHRRRPVANSAVGSVLALLRNGPATMRDCAAVVDTDALPEATVCTLMAQGLVQIDLETPMSPASVVTLPGRPFWRTK